MDRQRDAVDGHQESVDGFRESVDELREPVREHVNPWTGSIDPVREVSLPMDGPGRAQDLEFDDWSRVRVVANCAYDLAEMTIDDA